MGLHYKEVRSTLAELNELLLYEARNADWDSDPAGEKAALAAARRLLTELTALLTERIDELNYANPT
jgi:hypothetical protein